MLGADMQAARASRQSLWLGIVLLMSGGLGGFGRLIGQGSAGSLQKSGTTYYVDSTSGNDVPQRYLPIHGLEDTRESERDCVFSR